MRDDHLDLAMGRRESVKGLRGKAVGFDGVEAVVGLGGVVDQED